MLQLCTLPDMQCNKTNYSIMKETQGYPDFTQLGGHSFQTEPEISRNWHHLSAGNQQVKIDTTVNLSSGTE